jgi:peptidoglycan hydrolase-like protein with peptidoglycan-binding domain
MSRDTVRKIQRSLRQAGDNPGPIDGIVGPRTQAALRHYQQKEGLPVTGSLDAQTMQRLAANAPPPAATGSRKQGRSQAQPSGEQGRQTTGQLNRGEITQRLEAAGYSNVTGVESAGPNEYHARADRGNATYALDIDGKTGTIKSLRQVAGSGAPSTGSSAPSAAPSDQGGATGSMPGTQPAPEAQPQAQQPGQAQPAPGTTAPGQPQQ